MVEFELLQLLYDPGVSSAIVSELLQVLHDPRVHSALSLSVASCDPFVYMHNWTRDQVVDLSRVSHFEHYYIPSQVQLERYE